MRVQALGRLLALIALGAVIGGCGFLTDDGRDEVRVRVNEDDDDDDETPTTAGRDIDKVEDRFEVGDADEEDNRVILAALQDVEAYWENEFPDVFGDDFEPVSAFFAYGPDTESPPCGPTDPPYEEIAGNAFYCSGTDIIAWDTTELIPDLQSEFGDFTLGIVVAHEYGHAIQDRIGFDGFTITFEQQADCFAGAWAEWVFDDKAENFALRANLSDLDSALAGFLQLRDAINTSLLDPNAHGTAFDRVSAFQDGFFNGADSCADYSDGNVPAVPLEFIDETFFQNEPNAPFEDVEDFSVQDLNNFWTTVFDDFGEEWDEPEALALNPDGDLPECGDEDLEEEQVEGVALYCEPDDFVAWDEAELMPRLYEEIGDMAMAVTIGTQYSEAALEKLGDESRDEDRLVRRDCLTGAWIASSAFQLRGALDPETNPLGNVFVLSPGDLDEAVVAFLTNPGTDEAGTAFLRIFSLREGFFTAFEEENSTEGVERCLEIGDEEAQEGGG